MEIGTHQQKCIFHINEYFYECETQAIKLYEINYEIFDSMQKQNKQNKN